jgi:flagellar P-ring protein FlgI
MRVIFLILSFVLTLQAMEIRDVASVVGVRDNQLIGYSLVVGLKKTGDGTTSTFTLQSIANMLKAMNIDLDPANIKSKNVAAVVVTATLGPFARSGDKLNVTVSSIGDATSLQGGTLLMTPLKGVDGQIYALAQGPVSIGGKNERGTQNASHPTAGIVYGGGLVEKGVDFDLFHQKYATLSLKQSSFANAVDIQHVVNKTFKSRVAVALDPRTVRLKRPENLTMVEFLSQIEGLDMNYRPMDKVIINERTGTIVAGVNIQVMPVVITQGGITIKITPQDTLSKPAGSVQVDNNLVLGLNQDEVYTKKGTTTVANVVRALQKLGATPKDIISILEAMKSAGSIPAELQVI